MEKRRPVDTWNSRWWVGRTSVPTCRVFHGGRTSIAEAPNLVRRTNRTHKHSAKCQQSKYGEVRCRRRSKPPAPRNTTSQAASKSTGTLLGRRKSSGTYSVCLGEFVHSPEHTAWFQMFSPTTHCSGLTHCGTTH